MYPELISGTRPRRANLAALVLLTAGGVATLAAPAPACAQWTGGVQGGAVIRDGEQSNRLRLSLINQTRPLSHTIYADYFFGGGSDAYGLGYRPRYWFSDRLYALGELDFRVDEQIGIDKEFGQALGVGYQLFSDAIQSAHVEVSAGARQVSFTNPAIEDLSQPFGRIRGAYSRQLAELARFQLAASSTFADEFQDTQAEVGVTVNVSTFALTLGYRIITQRIEGQDAISDDTITFSFNYAL